MTVPVGLVAAHACTSPAVFACAIDEQCGAEGRCEAAGYCSFPDDACDSGRRYAPLSRDDLAGTCVPVSVADDSTSASIGEESTGEHEASTSTTNPTTAPTTTADTIDASTSSSDDAEVTDTTGEVDGRVHDGLVAYYTFHEGMGTTVHDLSEIAPPIDLTLVGSGFTWTRAGLYTAGQGIVLAQTSPTKIRTACQATDELTLEAWVTPANSLQPVDTPPARIVTYSSGTSARNFLLGQGTAFDFGRQTGEGFTGRVRTTDPGAENGTNPSLYVEVEVPTTTQHVVYTRRADGVETLHRDGLVIASHAAKTGTFSSWDDSEFQLALGNEIGLGRPFVGELHLVAIYDRALTQPEVEQNFDAGYEAP